MWRVAAGVDLGLLRIVVWRSGIGGWIGIRGFVAAGYAGVAACVPLQTFWQAGCEGMIGV
jgi:hypothetical protein